MKSVICLVVLLTVLPDYLQAEAGESNYRRTLTKLRDVLEEYKREEAIERFARLMKDDDEQVDHPSSLSDTSLLRYILVGLEKRQVNVIVKKFTVVIAGRSDVEMDLTKDLSNLKNNPITIKEGTEYRIKIYIHVQNEIVSGLRYHHVMMRKGITADKSTYMVGSYPPRAEVYSILLPAEEAPKGIIARGSYIVKSKLIDDDKNVILEWEWAFDVKKDWY